jgi:hypothetical protein
MDFGNLLTKVLPWIGAAATGNVPALIGMAAKEVADVLGVEVPATPEGIGAAVANATPEQMIALKDRELAFQERMQAMGFSHVEELAKIGLQETTLFVQDTADARKAHAADKGVFWMGVAVLLTFVVDIIATFWLVYMILVGGITIKDVGVVAALFGMLGTLNGYVAANAQQVLGYFFGSSKGSQDKTNAMADAVKGLGNIKR